MAEIDELRVSDVLSCYHWLNAWFFSTADFSGFAEIRAVQGIHLAFRYWRDDAIYTARKGYHHG